MHSRRSVLASLALAGGSATLLTACTRQEPAHEASHGTVSSVSAATAAATPSRLIDVRAFGATGDGSTDDHAAITAAIAAVQHRDHAGSGGVVRFPPGTYVVRKPLFLRKNIYLVGESAPSTKLLYAGPSAGAFLTFGKAKDIDTYSGIRSLWVDAGGAADVTVRLHGPQEGSYLSEAVITGARKIAVDVEAAGTVGGSNKFVIEKCWLWTTGDAGFAGVRLTQGGPITIRDTTAVGTNRKGRAPANSAGLVATRSAIVAVDSMNVEYFESHTYLDRTDCDLRDPSGFFNRYGVKTSKLSTGNLLSVTNAVFDRATSCILDQGAGVTLRYARTYISEAYPHDARHFRRNFWELGSANVYQSSSSRATMGYTSAATSDEKRFKFSTTTAGGWQEAASIDEDAVFGTGGSSWNGSHLRLGKYHLWVDDRGDLRMKNGAPQRDGDGRVVGS